MCAGAILQARVDTLVWGAPNKLLGADGSWVRYVEFICYFLKFSTPQQRLSVYLCFRNIFWFPIGFFACMAVARYFSGLHLDCYIGLIKPDNKLASIAIWVVAKIVK